LEKGIPKADVNITYNHRQATERDKVGGHCGVCYQGWQEVDARNADRGGHKDDRVQGDAKVQDNAVGMLGSKEEDATT
jgi:hypothetical protein